MSDAAAAVRQRFIESLTRRAASHGGEARRVLDDRLARMRADVTPPLPAPEALHSDASSVRGLAELVAHISSQASASQGPAVDSMDATLHYFRRTWSRLGADQRLATSLSAIPENAGPLNSQHLVHRSLALMRELSPDYFERFGTYLDALLAIEHANAARDASPPIRAAGSKKRSRGA